MGLRIHQLPPFIANQIAAGEVIERPASVVKELLENSYDAGADAITVEVGYGGLNQVKISDNGAGIHADDLPLALAAHATSKITKLDDLYAIDSMGFRGEALASIASVAKVTISSRPLEQEHAMMVRMQGGAISLSPCARAVGTTVDVSDIFFNAPVRKRFLKSEKLEFQAIETVIKRFALSAPKIALTLKHNGKLVLFLPSAPDDKAQLTRMSKIFGSTFLQDAVSLDVESGGMRLYGWVSGPKFQRSQNDRQWVYINQRMVKDKLINHALKQAYDGLLHPGRFPACLLYFTIPSSEVDVNVHPTKHEVRFAQTRLVHDFFTSQLSKALDLAKPAAENKQVERVLNCSREQVTHISEPYPVFSQDLLRYSASDASWTILNSRYVLIFMQHHPYVVDVIALYQKWLLVQLHQVGLPLAQRPLLVPVSFPLSQSLKKITFELQGILARLGLQVEFSNEKTILIRSVPIQLPYLDIRLFLDSIVALNTLDADKLLELLSVCQSFDPRLLSSEERMELNQLLLSSENLKLFCKVLTEDDCRMLFHA